MNPEPLELLSAFVDGEEIEPAELAAALADPGAREALRDFVLLRAEVLDDDRDPSSDTVRAIRRNLDTEASVVWWRRAIPIPAPALAAVVVLAVGAAVWAGFAFRRPVAEPFDAPPVPDRVLQLEAVENGRIEEISQGVERTPDSGGAGLPRHPAGPIG